MMNSTLYFVCMCGTCVDSYVVTPAQWHINIDKFLIDTNWTAAFVYVRPIINNNVEWTLDMNVVSTVEREFVNEFQAG